MSTPMSTAPQLGSGERLVSLEEAASLLRVSIATLQARMEHDRGPAGLEAPRYLTARQLEALAKEFARRRAGGSLSLDEAARFLEISEEEVLRLVESGELRESDPGAGFFDRDQIERIYVFLQGIRDPITEGQAAQVAKVNPSTIGQWVHVGWLKGLRVGKRLFVSRTAVEAEVRRRDRTRERLRILQDAGRLMTLADAAKFLGVSASLFNTSRMRRHLKPFRVERLWQAWYRRRDLERVMRLRVDRRKPPANTLDIAEAVDALGVSLTQFHELVRTRKLRVAAQRRTGRVVVNGYDPNEVASLKAKLSTKRERLAAVVTVAGASELLGVSQNTVRTLMRRRLLIPNGSGYPARFSREAVEALRNEPLVVEGMRRTGRLFSGNRGAHSKTRTTIEAPMFRRVRTLEEAARCLGVSEQTVREHMARGELRKIHQGRQFSKSDLLLLLARRNGIKDPIRLHEAIRVLPELVHMRNMHRLKSLRIGRLTFVSKSDVEKEIRRRERASRVEQEEHNMEQMLQDARAIGDETDRG